MGYLVRNEEAEEAAQASAVHLIMVDGEFFQHSAAQFWPTLIEEVVTAYPACTMLELAAPEVHALTHGMLDPCARLADDIQRYRDADVAELLRQTLAELELLGGPSTVMLRLCAGGSELYRHPIPPEYVDSEILEYLVCWLLEWARVDPSKWNDAFVGGCVVAEDPLRQRTYSLDFGLHRRHMSEGLHQRTLSLLPTIVGA